MYSEGSKPEVELFQPLAVRERGKLSDLLELVEGDIVSQLKLESNLMPCRAVHLYHYHLLTYLFCPFR